MSHVIGTVLIALAFLAVTLALDWLMWRFLDA